MGCTSDPEVTFTTLRPHTDQVLVMATDGVWDVLTNEQVRCWAQGYKKAGRSKGGREGGQLGRHGVRQACIRWQAGNEASGQMCRLAGMQAGMCRHALQPAHTTSHSLLLLLVQNLYAAWRPDTLCPCMLQVCDIVVESPDPHIACRRVLDAALYEWEERMSADNITVLVVEFEWNEDGLVPTAVDHATATAFR